MLSSRMTHFLETMTTTTTHFLKTARFNESLLLAAKEATFAYHAVIHGQSSKSSDFPL